MLDSNIPDILILISKTSYRELPAYLEDCRIIREENIQTPLSRTLPRPVVCKPIGHGDENYISVPHSLCIKASGIPEIVMLSVGLG